MDFKKGDTVSLLGGDPLIGKVTGTQGYYARVVWDADPSGLKEWPTLIRSADLEPFNPLLHTN